MGESKTSVNLLIIIGVLLVLSMILSFFAWRIPVFPGDLHLVRLFQTYTNPLFLSTMEWAAYLFGNWRAALLVITAGILIWWRLGGLEGILVWAAGLISLLNILFKIAVDRPRPSPEQVHVFVTYSTNGYPSGHAFFSTIFLGFLAYLLFTHLPDRFRRIFSLVILVLLILLVGASRIYLGAHWPSDVLGGYLIGGLFLTVLIWLYVKLKGRRTAGHT